MPGQTAPLITPKENHCHVEAYIKLVAIRHTFQTLLPEEVYLILLNERSDFVNRDIFTLKKLMI